MSKYFKYFPKITYQNQTVTDITRRAKIRSILRNSPYVLLPYTVENEFRPEDVAFYYYGSVDYTWIVYFSNDIIDPYTDWVMPQDVFENHLTKKYQTNRNLAETNDGFSGTVIEWTKRQSEGVTDNIVYYVNTDDDTLKLSPDSHTRSDWNTIAAQWRPVRVYEHENILNENKRQIELIDKRYIDLIVEDMNIVLR